MNSFQKMNAQGLEVQEIVKKHLEKRGNKVVDVSQVKEYQKIDIDFIISKGTEQTTLEVKKDKSLYKTGNIFIECGFQRGNYYSAGWIKYCKADYICFFDTVQRKGIILDRNKLILLLEQGNVISYYDKMDKKQGKAVLLPLEVAYKNNAIAYEWQE